MGIYLRGQYYWYKRQIEGVAYYKPLKVKRGQETLLSARIAQVDEQIVARHYGLPAPTSAGSIALSAFIPIYARRKSGKASLERDVTRLKIAVDIMGDRRLMSYGRDDFARLEERLFETGRSKATVNRYFALLHHAFGMAVKERYLRANPLLGHEFYIEDGEGGRALTDAEIRRLFDALRAERGGLYDFALFGLLTGARLSEIAMLRREQIDGDVARYRITETKFRKRGRHAISREKIIYLSPEALTVVNRQPQSPDGYVFAMRRRDPKIITKVFNEHRTRWGLPSVTFHWLRHTFISRAVVIAEPTLVRSLVGHSDFRTTLKYTHPDEAKKREVTTKIGTDLLRIV